MLHTTNTPARRMAPRQSSKTSCSMHVRCRLTSAAHNFRRHLASQDVQRSTQRSACKRGESLVLATTPCAARSGREILASATMGGALAWLPLLVHAVVQVPQPCCAWRAAPAGSAKSGTATQQTRAKTRGRACSGFPRSLARAWRCCALDLFIVGHACGEPRHLELPRLGELLVGDIIVPSRGDVGASCGHHRARCRQNTACGRLGCRSRR